MPLEHREPTAADDREMHRSYVRVALSWVAILACLYLFQVYFSTH